MTNFKFKIYIKYIYYIYFELRIKDCYSYLRKGAGRFRGSIEEARGRNKGARGRTEGAGEEAEMASSVSA